MLIKIVFFKNESEKLEIMTCGIDTLLYTKQSIKIDVIPQYPFNPLTAKLFNLNIHPLEVVSR